MNNVFFLAASLSLSVFVGAATAATVVSSTATLSGGTLLNFEGVADGTNSDNLYVGSGVTFSATTGSTRIWNPAFPPGGQVASSGTGVLGPSASPSPISMSFASGQSFVEFFFADTLTFAGTTYTISAFDTGASFLESIFLSASELTTPDYLSFVSGSANIGRIDFTPSNTGENFSIDDLRFGVTAVPIPATLPLLLAGVGAFGALRSRRKKT